MRMPDVLLPSIGEGNVSQAPIRSQGVCVYRGVCVSVCGINA